MTAAAPAAKPNRKPKHKPKNKPKMNTERKQERGRSMNEFFALIDWIKTIADKSNAGRAYVDFLQDDGALIRIEYKPAKRKEATK